MNKDLVDNIIVDYQKKIYGFALSKTKDIDKAEEVASRIIYEVYTALLKADKIHNINSYIYRIASNVYSRYVNEEISGEAINDIDTNTFYESDPEREDDYARIRKEIGYLSSLQREIVVMYYYQKMKVNDIAKKLNTYSGKVKWHLFEARNQIKEGFLESKKKGISNEYITRNEKKHIKFSQMIQFGLSSPLNIDMSFYFRKILSQSIALSAYYNPKSCMEIAKELGVAAAFVEDEIGHLVENRFMDKVAGNRYLTKIFITETKDDRDIAINELLSKYVEPICELYIPLLLKEIKNWKNGEEISIPITNKNKSTISLSKTKQNNSFKIFTPENDINFLTWSIVTFGCKHKLVIVDNRKDLFKLTEKRKDGGDYIAAAMVNSTSKDSLHLSQNITHESNWDERKKSPQKAYKDFGDLYSGEPDDSIRVWEFFSQYDDLNRKPNFQLDLLFDTFLSFLSGNLEKEAYNIDKYVNLFEKGFLLSKTSRILKGNQEIKKAPYKHIFPTSKINTVPTEDFLNMVITNISETDFENILPTIPNELKMLGKELDEEMHNINKPYYPQQMQNLCRLKYQNSFTSGQMRVRVIDFLLKQGVLLPLKKNQKKTANMIMFLTRLY
ncbi:MAG: sigma-70 family RNA polymerase sigma factor [Candidatus Cloacimonetes bacterium]|nr:sigma-70 family RNA polymerase sigma factor [Candidatus Cloacimonadota bacterium]